jgi:hypothetical protein
MSASEVATHVGVGMVCVSDCALEDVVINVDGQSWKCGKVEGEKSQWRHGRTLSIKGGYRSTNGAGAASGLVARMETTREARHMQAV